MLYIKSRVPRNRTFGILLNLILLLSFGEYVWGCGPKRIVCLSENSFKFCFKSPIRIFKMGNTKYCPPGTICSESIGTSQCIGVERPMVATETTDYSNDFEDITTDEIKANNLNSPDITYSEPYYLESPVDDKLGDTTTNNEQHYPSISNSLVNYFSENTSDDDYDKVISVINPEITTTLKFTPKLLKSSSPEKPLTAALTTDNNCRSEATTVSETVTYPWPWSRFTAKPLQESSTTSPRNVLTTPNINYMVIKYNVKNIYNVQENNHIAGVPTKSTTTSRPTKTKTKSARPTTTIKTTASFASYNKNKFKNKTKLSTVRPTTKLSNQKVKFTNKSILPTSRTTTTKTKGYKKDQNNNKTTLTPIKTNISKPNLKNTRPTNITTYAKPSKCSKPAKYPSSKCNQYYECLSVMWWFRVITRNCKKGESFDITTQKCTKDDKCV